MHRFIILHFTFCFLALSGQEVSKPVPTAYFSVVFGVILQFVRFNIHLGGIYRRKFHKMFYTLSVWVLSGKCAYYGKNDIEFYGLIVNMETWRG